MKPTRTWLIALSAAALMMLLAWYAHSRLTPPMHGRQSLSPDRIEDWKQYDGTWVAEQGTFSDLKGGLGDKLVTGDPSMSDYKLDSDLRFDSDRNQKWGDAGVILRASNVQIGTDSYYGYYAGLRLNDQSLVFARIENEYIELAVAKLPEPVRIGQWYHLSITAQGCEFRIVAQSMPSLDAAKIDYTDVGCGFRNGSPGIRSYGMQSSWRNFEVQSLP
jgi:hypothetical protein